MTSWDLTSLLLLMLLNSDLSEQHCLDYLKKDKMEKKPLFHMVPFVKAKNHHISDAIICTLAYECKNNSNVTCNLLSDCLEKDEDDTSGCEEKENSCDYVNVCQLHSDITSQAQTTTRPPSSTTSERTPTAPSTLLAETTGTLMQKTRTTAPRTLLPQTLPSTSSTRLPKATPSAPEQKTTRTTTAPTAFSLTTTATTTQLQSKGDKAPTTAKKIGESNLMNLLLLSMTFNVIGPLLVYLFMRWRARNQTPVAHDEPWEEGPHTGTHLQFQNMHSGTGAETLQLMQITETAADITSAADPDREEFTERDSLPS